MADVIRVPAQFPDGGERLILNPLGTLLAVLAYDREGDGHVRIRVYSVADGQPLGDPLKLRDSRTHHLFTRLSASGILGSTSIAHRRNLMWPT